jgi:hypothetical protein
LNDKPQSEGERRMPGARRRKSASVWDKNSILTAIKSHSYDDKVGCIDDLPRPEDVRRILEKELKICSNRHRRLFLVEKIGDYQVFISIPDGKSDCDFVVWRYDLHDPDRNIVRIPTHDYLAKIYNNLKCKNEIINEFLINSVIKLLRERLSIEKIINKYYKDLDTILQDELRKFLATLKWVGLQEDVNYPPPDYLGSKMTLAVYVLLEAGFDISEIRKIIRFK